MGRQVQHSRVQSASTHWYCCHSAESRIRSIISEGAWRDKSLDLGRSAKKIRQPVESGRPAFWDFRPPRDACLPATQPEGADQPRRSVMSPVCLRVETRTVDHREVRVLRQMRLTVGYYCGIYILLTYVRVVPHNGLFKRKGDFA